MRAKFPRRRPPAAHTCGALLAALLVLALAATAPAAVATPGPIFEGGPVRPLALSPDGSRLFACNVPDGRLEILRIAPDGMLTPESSVAVGLEPVAVAARTDGEVWVVNHLSDSVSVVDVTGPVPRVVRTLLVGDEPRDVVFAGLNRARAFVTTARRGQNLPPSVPALLTTPGTPRALVWVFDADHLSSDLGGTPLTVLELFADTPRALAATADGSRVYAAAFLSGNRTTTVSEGIVCDGGASAPACTVLGTTYPGGLPAPNTDANGVPGPETGLIVGFDGTRWRDDLGRDWSPAVRFSLPDSDVFEIDALADPPVTLRAFAGVGTTIFNLGVNPATGAVYASNTEARNLTRFEGAGGGGSTVRGRLAESRVTVIDGAGVRARHLNSHIDYDVVPSPAGTLGRSLATPVDLAVSADGGTLWVAALGSDVVAALDTTALADGTYVSDTADHVAVAGGPSGLALDEARGRLYVLARFDDAVAVVDVATRAEIGRVRFHDPEPPAIATGRRFLYDARATSTNGEAACASCHVFGDVDGLAWDLGDPDGTVRPNPNPLHSEESDPSFHPLKGPMTTQSLRGLANAGPMHWRGDRTGGDEVGGDPLAEDQAFRRFLPAFDALLGRPGRIAPFDMEQLTTFVLALSHPPNPVRNLDGSLTPLQQAGRDRYFGAPSRGDVDCNGCHALVPSLGFFGTDGATAFQLGPQPFKIPHLRNAYAKVGMFGMPAVPFLGSAGDVDAGPQVRGFGFLHDGSVDTLRRFHGAAPFTLDADDPTALEAFVLAYDSNLAPAVGQQVTLADPADPTTGARLDLLTARAAAGACDLVVKGVLAGAARGFVLGAGGLFTSDRAADPPWTAAALRAEAQVGAELTYTCAPPGTGMRLGVDRDGDGRRDRDELDAGTDPADAADPGGTPVPTPTPTPATPPSQPVASRVLFLRERPARNAPALRTLRFRTRTAAADGLVRIAPPQRAGLGDPTLHGGRLRVYNAAGRTADDVAIALPAAHWTAVGGRRPRGFRYRPPAASGLPIRRILVQRDRIVVEVHGRAWPYTLDEPAQGRVGIVLELGGSVFCADAPAKDPRNDRPGWFVGAYAAPPADCPSTQ